jgi:fructose-specific phosphotransferase system IIA component
LAHPLELINEDVILPHLRARTKVDALRELVNLLASQNIVVNSETFLLDVLARESTVPTNVGFGIAIPHARSRAVAKPGIAIGKTEGLLWDEEDKEPVKLVFLLAIPSDHTEQEYIKILSLLARKLVSKDFRQKLMAAQTKQEIVQAISIELSKECE